MKAVLYLIALISFITSAYGQKKSYHAELANIYFEKKSYLNAIPHLKHAIRKKPSNDTLIAHLGISYYYTRQLEQACNTFEYMEQKNLLKDSLVTYYFNTLKQQGNYGGAKKLILKQENQKLKKMSLFCDSAVAWLRKTRPVKINNLKKLNTEYSETCPGLHPNGLYFLSNRESTIIEKTSGFDGLPYQSAYLSYYNSDSVLKSPGIYNELSGTNYHAGAAFFVEDSMLVYFTKVQKDRDNVLRSKLYLEDLRKKSQIGEKLFILNDSLYSFMHPCIDREQKLFFFASKMPGGYGGTDIYVSIRIEKAWSEPINLGPVINSPYNEIHPFYDAENRLFISSDRPEGMGGYDIFVGFQKDGEWTFLQNLRAPVNSSSDEMGFLMRKNLKTAYFCSNRPGGMGKEDIYEVTGKLFLLFDKK